MNSKRGTASKSIDIQPLLAELASAWRSLSADERVVVSRNNTEIAADITESLGAIRVLFVTCNPKDTDHIRVSGELRVAREAVHLGRKENHIEIDSLPAATIDDLRRKLMRNTYEIVHFAGHSDSDNLAFETPDGSTQSVPIEAVSQLISKYPSIKCVILNGCESAASLDHAIAGLTIGMGLALPDDAALEFTRGFYDRLAAGSTYREAADEGILSLQLKGHSEELIRVFERGGG